MNAAGGVQAIADGKGDVVAMMLFGSKDLREGDGEAPIMTPDGLLAGKDEDGVDDGDRAVALILVIPSDREGKLGDAAAAEQTGVPPVFTTFSCTLSHPSGTTAPACKRV